jgi:hypothetical protein
MEFIPPLAAMTIKSFQENSDVRFNHKQSAAFPSNKCDEISTRRRDKPRRLQSEPQRLRAASTSELKLARVELALPGDFFVKVFFSGRGGRTFRKYANPATAEVRWVCHEDS